MAGFHSTASDTWVHAGAGQGGARGKKLGHLISFLESFVFEQQVLSLCDFRP